MDLEPIQLMNGVSDVLGLGQDGNSNKEIHADGKVCCRDDVGKMS